MEGKCGMCICVCFGFMCLFSVAFDLIIMVMLIVDIVGELSLIHI